MSILHLHDTAIITTIVRAPELASLEFGTANGKSKRKMENKVETRVMVGLCRGMIKKMESTIVICW